MIGGRGAVEPPRPPATPPTPLSPPVCSGLDWDELEEQAAAEDREKEFSDEASGGGQVVPESCGLQHLLAAGQEGVLQSWLDALARHAWPQAILAPALRLLLPVCAAGRG